MASLPAASSLRRLRHTGKSAGSAADHYQENRAGSKKSGNSSGGQGNTGAGRNTGAGYFISINGHYFVGRNGPTCPYCTGGYVDFEFTSDGDFTGYEDGVTWIKVYGILREATVHLNDHLTAPFYHLEAVKVEKMDQPGIGTITD